MTEITRTVKYDLDGNVISDDGHYEAERLERVAQTVRAPEAKPDESTTDSMVVLKLPISTSSEDEQLDDDSDCCRGSNVYDEYRERIRSDYGFDPGKGLSCCNADIVMRNLVPK